MLFELTELGRCEVKHEVVVAVNRSIARDTEIRLLPVVSVVFELLNVEGVGLFVSQVESHLHAADIVPTLFAKVVRYAVVRDASPALYLLSLRVAVASERLPHILQAVFLDLDQQTSTVELLDVSKMVP